MKTFGKQLHGMQIELGLTPIEVCAEADVSIATLYKVYGDKPCRASTINRVFKALERLKLRTRAYSKAVG